MPNTKDHLTIWIKSCASPNKLRNDRARGGSFGYGASGLSFFGGFSVIVGSAYLARRRPDAAATHTRKTRQRLILAGVWQGWWRTAARIAGDSAAAAN